MSALPDALRSRFLQRLALQISDREQRLRLGDRLGREFGLEQVRNPLAFVGPDVCLEIVGQLLKAFDQVRWKGGVLCVVLLMSSSVLFQRTLQSQ